MLLEQLNCSFLLKFDENSSVSLKTEWVDMLRKLSFEEYGPALHGTIYPAFSAEEKKIWNKSFTSNKDLFSAIQNHSGSSCCISNETGRSPSVVEGEA